MTIADVLTAEQRAVVEQPVDALVLVTAGPGAGKTHTLVRRLEHLVTRHDVAAGEVLVLTFSRAAVRELQLRLATVDSPARHFRARTFDSWALELLTAVAPDGQWQSKSFDERIRAAVRAVMEGQADAFCDELVHVVIDEVQDLVGYRRVMVESVLERFACGFTVVGDPAQAIYGFQAPDGETRKYETNRFFIRLRELFASELVELSLKTNFRVRDSAAEIALRFSDELQKARFDGVAVRTEVRGALLDAPSFGNLHDDFARSALSRSDVTTAVLCRTNGQALVVSEDLHRAGVPHRLQRSASDRVVPAWIGSLFAPGGGPMLTRSTFEGLVMRSVPGDDLDLWWMWLIRASSRGGDNRSIDLGNLRAAMVSGSLPDELFEQSTAPVTVSSFHRAKGLEFDRVIVADPGGAKEWVDEDPEEEARMLYVAMTRARDDVLRIENPTDGRIRKDRTSDRWARYGWKQWQRLGLEVGAADVSQEEPPGSRLFEADGVDLQRYLLEAVRPADEIVLERVGDQPFGPYESPPYLVLHESRPIGLVSQRFRTDLKRFLSMSRKEPQWPLRITGLRTDTIEAVVGGSAASAAAGLGGHGVWLVPRISGLGVFLYGGTTGREDG
jgi:hypothetical protein